MGRKTVITCDRCGVVAEDETLGGWYALEKERASGGTASEKLLCPECAAKHDAFMANEPDEPAVRVVLPDYMLHPKTTADVVVLERNVWDRVIGTLDGLADDMRFESDRLRDGGSRLAGLGQTEGRWAVQVAAQARDLRGEKNTGEDGDG